MKYYAHIIKITSEHYWYRNLTNELILVDGDIKNVDVDGDDYGDFYEVIELTDKQSSRVKRNENTVGYTLFPQDVKVYSEVELRLKKVKKLMGCNEVHG